MVGPKKNPPLRVHAGGPHTAPREVARPPAAHVARYVTDDVPLHSRTPRRIGPRQVEPSMRSGIGRPTSLSFAHPVYVNMRRPLSCASLASK
ncbi:hypothetical protein ACLOJK_010022 [Asimina triloba]